MAIACPFDFDRDRGRANQTTNAEAPFRHEAFASSEIFPAMATRFAEWTSMFVIRPPFHSGVKTTW
jgi:hypothetical protein